jgi:putative transposase
VQRPVGRPDVEPTDPFRYFRSSPEVICLAALMYVRSSLSLFKVEDVLFQRGIDTCHETVTALAEPLWADVGRGHSRPAGRAVCERAAQWHLDEMYNT